MSNGDIDVTMAFASIVDFAIGAVLSQPDDEGTLHLVAFYSRKFTAPEINYPVYDQELAAIISTFTESRPYLAWAQHRIQVLTDHKNLIYFTTSRTLNRRQANGPLSSPTTTLRSCFNLEFNMGKLMPSLGVRILHCAQEMMHIHNNPIVCCGLINFRCLPLACCRMILCSTRSPGQPR